ncbi:MAG: DUF6089 family protein [Flavobacteriales bacterium]
MKRCFQIAVLFLTSVVTGHAPLLAQQPSLGVMGGASYYIGELNPYEHFGDGTHYAGGVLYRHPLSERFLLRGQLSFGKVSGTDADARTEFRKNRNLHFRSNIIEVAGIVELNFFKHAIGDENDIQTPYLFAGLAYFRMNPEARYQGEWYKLQPLGTEGQGVPNTGREPYHLDQIAIPFGLGIKVNLGKWVTLGAEWGMRKTYTDYLDDVSSSYVGSDRLRNENGGLAAELANRRKESSTGGTLAGKERGDPEDKDWYVFSGLTLNFRVARKESVCSSFNSGQ